MKNIYNQIKSAFAITLILIITGGLDAQTFKTLNVGNNNIKLQGIEYYNETEGYMCGDEGSIYKINTDESTDEITTPTTANLWRISIIPGTQGKGFIAVGDNNTILKSNDGGATITQLNVPQTSGSFVFGVHCLDANTYFACGGDNGLFSGTVLKTTDGGATWNVIPIQGTLFMDNIFFVDNATGYVAGGGQLNGGVFKTTDGGTSWQSVLNTSALMVNIYCFDKDKVIATGLDGQIFKTTDGGQNWTDLSKNGDGYYGIKFLNNSTGYIAGGSGLAVLLQTEDEGDTWTPVSTPSADNFWNLGLTSKRVGLVTSSGNWMSAMSTAPPPVAVQNLQKEFINIYPNPAKNKVHIDIVGEGVNMATFSTIAGKQMLSVHLDKNNNTINTDALPAGVYFVSLTSPEGRVYNQKIIVD